jgi:4-amino-4-deoxy-L-arabinose transferase-like glycosyltransferase
MQLVHSNLETTPPGYFIVAWMVNQVVGDSTLAARLVSFVAGVAAIPLTFVLGVMTLRNRLTALLGALLVALAPFMIFFSSEGRAYMLAMVLCLISTIGLLKSVRTNAIAWWVVYGAASAAAVYTHYTTVFLLGLQIVWAAARHRRAWRGLLLANAAVVLCYLPWLSGLRQDLKTPNVLGLLVPASLGNAGGVTQDWWIGHPVISLGQIPGHLAVGLAAAGLVVGVLGFLLGGSLVARLRTATPERWLIPLLAIGPPLVIIFYSFLRTSILEGRNFLTSWPALALTMAAVVLLPTILWARWIAVVLLVAAYSIGAVTSVLPVNQRPNLDAAVVYIDAHAGRTDPLVNVPIFNNPLSELDVALSRKGQSTYTPGQEADSDPLFTAPGQHHVFRLGATPLSVQLRDLAGPQGQPDFNSLAAEDPAVVARQTLQLADRVSAGQFVYVGPPLIFELRIHASPVSKFVGALPAGYHVVDSAQMRGSYGGLFPIEVDVFQPTAHPGSH